MLVVADRAIFLGYRDRPVAWGTLIGQTLFVWYACALFIPVLYWATRRFPVDQEPVAVNLSIHVALILAVSAATLAITVPLTPLFFERQTTLAESFAGGFFREVLAFGAVAALLQAIDFFRRYQERQTRAAQLEAQLSDAQLHALRAQLNPHFLFNTLNAATALIQRDPRGADAMLTRLGELLRLTLRADPAHETPLAEELELLERYLAIMRVRFEGKVVVETDVSPQAARAMVPSFVLQPLVENAFEHGMARLQRPGRIRIVARPEGDSLLLTVEDDGPGPVRPGDGTGVGLSNTRRRLAGLYGAAASLTLGALPAGGTSVSLRLPLRTAPA